MTSTTVAVGEVANIANDVASITQNLQAGTASGGDVAAAANAAASIGAALLNNPFTAALAGTTAGAQLAAEYSKLQAAIAAGNTDGMVDATLGLIGAAGGVIAMAPSPQTKALGVAVAATAAAAKELYKNREAIGSLLDDILSQSEQVQAPVVHISMLDCWTQTHCCLERHSRTRSRSALQMQSEQES